MIGWICIRRAGGQMEQLSSFKKTKLEDRQKLSYCFPVTQLYNRNSYHLTEKQPHLKPKNLGRCNDNIKELLFTYMAKIGIHCSLTQLIFGDVCIYLYN